MGKWGDIAELAGYLNEPYQTDRVMGWARLQEDPFTMREAVAAIGLPRWTIHRILCRQVKKGALTRTQLRLSFFATGLGKQATRLTYIYSFVRCDDA